MEAVCEPATEQMPQEVDGLRGALIRQREYTLALYADLPDKYWSPADFPYLPIVNPPLWELAHIAWFAEFFCLRWRPDDLQGQRTPSSFAPVDALFNSQTVPHVQRWRNAYPSKDACFSYMRRALQDVLQALENSASDERYAFQLAVAHEDMHAEALAMTLNTLGLTLPECVGQQGILAGQGGSLPLGGGDILLGGSQRNFRFDNEMPARMTSVAPFAIASQPVTGAEFAAFLDSADYRDNRFWSDAGCKWRDAASALTRHADANRAAAHVSYHEAEAWCRWAGRRLPSEAEWEFAAVNSAPFRQSCGQVWEWTSTAFAPFPGFSPGRYRDYSVPWFGTHQVLKGGSFVTHPRLKYPQYRNFYTPDRRDMFCGFRSCEMG